MLILFSSLQVTLSLTFATYIFCKHFLQPLISQVNTENVEWYWLKSSFQDFTYMHSRKSEITTVWVQVFKQFCTYWSWPNSDLGKPKYSFPILYGYSTWSMHLKKPFLEAKYVTVIVSCLSITLLMQKVRKLDLELALAQAVFGNPFWLFLIILLLIIFLLMFLIPSLLTILIFVRECFCIFLEP